MTYGCRYIVRQAASKRLHLRKVSQWGKEQSESDAAHRQGVQSAIVRKPAAADALLNRLVRPRSVSVVLLRPIPFDLKFVSLPGCRRDSPRVILPSYHVVAAAAYVRRLCVCPCPCVVRCASCHALVLLRCASYDQLHSDPARLLFELSNDFYPYIQPDHARCHTDDKPRRSLPPLDLVMHMCVAHKLYAAVHPHLQFFDQQARQLASHLVPHCPRMLSAHALIRSRHD